MTYALLLARLMPDSGNLQLSIYERPLWSALQQCEVYCVALCCGPDAFELSPDYMREWVDRADATEIATAIGRIDTLLERANSHAGPVELIGVAGISGREEAIAWLSQIKTCLVEAVT